MIHHSLPDAVHQVMDGRICHPMVCSSIMGEDGQLPRCIGPSCVRYEVCAGDIILSVREIRHHRRAGGRMP